MTEKVYLSYADVEGHVQSILHDLEKSHWRPDYIVGLTRGGLLPATLISQYTGVPMYSLDVSLRDNKDTMGPESNCWMAEDALGKKRILIVDDINDSGATLDWIVDDWKSTNRPASPEWNTVFGDNVRIATIVNNNSSNFKEISYTGTTIYKDEHDVWIVFPWEDWWTAKPE